MPPPSGSASTRTVGSPARWASSARAAASTVAPAPPQPGTMPAVVAGATGGSTAAIIRWTSHSAAAGRIATWSAPSRAAAA
jgi:hypothetical protein